jgi:tetratricopeptide (TPR) repeat protein
MLKPGKNQWLTTIPLVLACAVAGYAITAFAKTERSSLPEAFRYKFSEALGTRTATRTEAFAQEIGFLQERVNRNPDSALDLTALAGGYIGKARVTGQNTWYILAEQAAERSLGLLPLKIGNAGGQLALAEVAQARHDFAGALGLIREVTASQPNNSSAISLRATIMLALGEPEAARRDVDALVGTLPNVSNLTLRATIAEAQGRLEATRQDFERALSIEEPDDAFGSARTRTLFARFLVRHGEYDLARGLLEEALKIAPHYPLALLHLADLEFRQGRSTQAETRYKELLFISRDSPSTYDHAAQQGLARVKQAQGASDAKAGWLEAETTLRREITKGAFGHRRELARLLLERGRPQDVPEALNQATRELETRHDWETLSALAWAQQRAGQMLEARETVNRALSTGVQDAELELRAANIERVLGHLEEAQKREANAARIDPHFDTALRARYGLN